MTAGWRLAAVRQAAGPFCKIVDSSALIWLAVELQQVVLGKTEATDGRLGFQATMRPMSIVAMEPNEQLSRSLIRSSDSGERRPIREARFE